VLEIFDVETTTFWSGKTFKPEPWNVAQAVFLLYFGIEGRSQGLRLDK
jgi:hypothetical protein